MTASNSNRESLLRSLFICGLFIFVPTLLAQNTEHHKLLASDGVAADRFGSAVATDGTRVAVGAPLADQSGSSSGSAYLFDTLSGAELLELVPGTGAAGDQLGTSVAIDGAGVVVGAPLADVFGADSGAAYVFDSATGAVVHTLTPADAAAGDQFGQSVAIDGNLVVVGTLGAAYLFDASSGQQLFKLLPTGGSTTLGLSGFGESVAIDSGLVVVGAHLENGVSGLAGAVYVFDAATGTQLHRLVAQDGTAWAFFGRSVDIDGDVVAIGAPEASPLGFHSGAAYVFDASSGQQTIKLVPSDGHLFARFGSSVGVDGLQVIIGSDENNAGGVFTSGAVYVYDAQSFGFVTKLVASDADSGDELGGAVAVANGVLVAGAKHDADNGSDSGSAYVFDAAGTVTTMAQCLVNAGSLTHVGGLAVAGQTLSFRMNGAQTGATYAVFMGSAAPAAGWPTCGVNLGSAGELLLSLPIVFTTAAWTGAPVDFPVAIPAFSGLDGLPFYLQGAFAAPGSATEPVRLTDGLHVVLGGYL